MNLKKIFAVFIVTTMLATSAAYASDDKREDKKYEKSRDDKPKATPSPEPSESESPKPEPTETPKPTPTPTPSPTPSPTTSPTPTPSPTPTVTPTPTPTPTIITPVPPQKPVELGGSDPKPSDPPVKEVVESYSKTVRCGSPVTFELTGPNDAKYTILQQPKKGKISINLNNKTVTWTPDKGHCKLGGNDRFVIQWTDSKGNRGIITKIIVTLIQGDIPNLIRTGA